jgi:hypothetical protein
MILVSNLADCWWQIPPFGKDFQARSAREKGENPEDMAFRKLGTVIA